MSILPIGELLELEIESLAYRGAGVARLNGLVVFVPETCPGEKVRARVTRAHPRFLEAELDTVLEPAACRIAPCCRTPGPEGLPLRVPGCVYDHLAYPAELAAKQRQYLEFLARQAGIVSADACCAPPLPSPRPLHYRSRIVLHTGPVGARDPQKPSGVDGARGLGYRDAAARTVVDLPACPLAVEPINEVLQALRCSVGFPGLLRRETDVTFRWTPSDGVVHWAGRPPRGAPVLRESTPAGVLEVPPDGFSQVNPDVAAPLVERVVAFLRSERPPALVDLYCGVGVFALAAEQAGIGRVLGVETGRAAVAAARRNARRLGLMAEFACLPAAEGLQDALAALRGTPAAVLADPPREGLDAGVLRGLLHHRPPLLLYVSCAPDTLARDLRILVREGDYRLDAAGLFDMFPRTAHFETLNLLRRG